MEMSSNVKCNEQFKIENSSTNEYGTPLNRKNIFTCK